MVLNSPLAFVGSYSPHALRLKQILGLKFKYEYHILNITDKHTGEPQWAESGGTVVMKLLATAPQSLEGISTMRFVVSTVSPFFRTVLAFRMKTVTSHCTCLQLYMALMMILVQRKRRRSACRRISAGRKRFPPQKGH